jgi:ABC-type sugar transport system substrate-binding protein
MSAMLTRRRKALPIKALTKALLREWLKPDYENLALITTVFAGGNVQKAYAETLAIVQAYPGLRGIIAPDAAALMGASAPCVISDAARW